jgi:hypothetical protein
MKKYYGVEWYENRYSHQKFEWKKTYDYEEGAVLAFESVKKAKSYISKQRKIPTCNIPQRIRRLNDGVIVYQCGKANKKKTS